MEQQKNTKVCSCCGIEYEPKYFYRSYSVCKICVSKKKNEGTRKPVILRNSKSAAVMRKNKIEMLRQQLEELGKECTVLARKMKIDEYIEASKRYSVLLQQIECLKAK